MKITESNRDLDLLVCIADWKTAALQSLEPTTAEYFRGGADDEITLNENSSAYNRWKILPRYLVDVSTINLQTKVLGRPVSLPIGISPTAFQRLAHSDGELATVRAAHRFGTVYVQSLLSTTSFEDIRAQAPNCRHWAQIYILRNQDETEEIVKRAEKAGVEALVITVDGPYYGKRRANLRNPVVFSPHLCLPNIQSHASDLTYSKAVAFSHTVKNSATWEDIKWIKSITSLPVVLKGIMTEDDAELSVDAGVEGIWISNHGGRQLDTVMPTIEVLPSIAKAVDKRCEIYIDGGISRGTDILKALALGANMVFTGRAPIWGLTVAGEDGVVRVLETLKSELELGMGLSGRPSISLLNKSMVQRSEPNYY